MTSKDWILHTDIDINKHNKWMQFFHDYVIKWKHFPSHWPFARGIRRWIIHTKASDVDIWCILWSALEQTAEKTIEIWDAIALIMASL